MQRLTLKEQRIEELKQYQKEITEKIKAESSKLPLAIEDEKEGINSLLDTYMEEVQDVEEQILFYIEHMDENCNLIEEED